MTLTHSGSLIHERCPDQRSTHRNGYRERVLSTQVGDLTLVLPKRRQGSFLPNGLETRRWGDKALYAVVLEASTSPPASTVVWAATCRSAPEPWSWRSASIVSAPLLARCNGNVFGMNS